MAIPMKVAAKEELEVTGISLAARDARFWARSWFEYLGLLDAGLDSYLRF